MYFLIQIEDASDGWVGKHNSLRILHHCCINGPGFDIRQRGHLTGTGVDDDVAVGAGVGAGAGAGAGAGVGAGVGSSFRVTRTSIVSRSEHADMLAASASSFVRPGNLGTSSSSSMGNSTSVGNSTCSGTSSVASWPPAEGATTLADDIEAIKFSPQAVSFPLPS